MHGRKRRPSCQAEPTKRRRDALVRGGGRLHAPTGHDPCDVDEDCAAQGGVCDPDTKYCVSRDSDRGKALLGRLGTDLDVLVARRAAAETLPRHADAWTLRPGQKGFNQYVLGLLLAAGLHPTLDCAVQGDRWYQRVLAWLVRPETPIRRLLVAWQLGVGKTLGMLRVLENYFFDPRPKILVFPTDALVTNFYEELVVRKNRYFAEYRAANPSVGDWPTGEPATADEAEALARRRQDYLDGVATWLGNWPFGVANATGLPAPLRAFSYLSAAGAGIKDNTVLHWPDRRQKATEHLVVDRTAEDDTFLYTVLLFDEAHNMVRPSSAVTAEIAAAQRRGAGKEATRSPDAVLKSLRERVRKARDAVVVLFTATPIVRVDPEDGGPHGDARSILEVTKGAEYATADDEGFVSWYMERPPELFAATTPARLTQQLPAVTEVFLDDTLLWDVYAHVRYGRYLPREARRALVGPSPAGTKPSPQTKPKLTARFGGPAGPAARPCLGRRPPDPPCPRDWAVLEHTGWLEHFVPPGASRPVAEPKTALEMAPKLAAIAESVRDVPLKTLILIHEANGVPTLVQLLETHGLRPLLLKRPTGTANEQARIRFENQQRRRAFNDPGRNLRGKEHRVLVAVSEEFSEGVSFAHVRRVILADWSAGLETPSFALVQQRIGRALRACSHHALPANMRRLRVDAFVVRHHKTPTYPPTIDEEKWEYLKGEAVRMGEAMAYLRGFALDAEYYAMAARPNASRTFEFSKLAADPTVPQRLGQAVGHLRGLPGEVRTTAAAVTEATRRFLAEKAATARAFALPRPGSGPLLTTLFTKSRISSGDDQPAAE